MLIQRSYQLRRFTPADLESVININRICLPENYASYFFLDTYNALPETFIVAEAQGRVVGYIMCRIEHGFSDVRKLRFAKKGHIISVAVMPEFRNMGIATSLVTEAMTALAAMHVDECFLEVRVSNQPAINLYRKLAFEITRTMPRYYFDGSDAYIMSRPLN